MTNVGLSKSVALVHYVNVFSSGQYSIDYASLSCSTSHEGIVVKLGKVVCLVTENIRVEYNRMDCTSNISISWLRCNKNCKLGAGVNSYNTAMSFYNLLHLRIQIKNNPMINNKIFMLELILSNSPP